MKKGNNFREKKQKGISLIVLVITIIIIVILSTAILVSVVSNNPVMESNKARYDSDTANMQAIFTNTVAKVMAQNRASIEITPDRINEFVSGVSESVGEVSYTVMNAMDINNTDGKIYFDKGTNTATTYYTGRKLPIYSAGETKWFVDKDGNISLEVAGTKYGNGETIVLEGEGQTYHTFAPSTLSFRSTADLEDFKEVKINGETIDPSNYTLTEGSTIVTLSIDYLKTLEAKEHEITIVSKNASPTAKFEVFEPDLNKYNFYYNQPYTAYVDSFNSEISFFLREDGTAELINITHESIEMVTWSNNGDEIEATTSVGKFNGIVSSDGMEINFPALGSVFKIGMDSIAADEHYIYINDEYYDGYRVMVIDKNKESYKDIPSNINNKLVVSLHNTFLGCKNLKITPILPDTIIDMMGSFTNCTSLIKVSNFPKNVWDLSETFTNCTSLVTVPNIPKTTATGLFATFRNCSSLVTAPVIPNNIEALEEVFSGCSSLNSVTIPKTVTTFWTKVFSDCTNLKEIIFTGTVEDFKSIELHYTTFDEVFQNVPATEVKCSDGTVAIK